MSSKQAQQNETKVEIQILDKLKAEGVKYVRLTWVDFVNCVRYRVIPVNQLRKLVLSSNDDASAKTNPHAGILFTKATMGLVGVTCAEGFGPVGMYKYIPDVVSASPLAFAPTHVAMMGWLEEHEGHADAQNSVSYSSDLCPRMTLAKITSQAANTHGISFLIGFETEVIFLRSTSPIQAVNDHGWSESPAILAGSPESRALDEIADALETARIVLEMFHSEGAPGQYEFVTGPLPPLAACDALVFTREIILNIAAKHGLKATMTPRIFSDNCGSAAHTHISLKSNKLPSDLVILPGDVSPSLSSYEASFLAGLLEHLPGAVAFTLPTPASYDRMLDGVWSGGTYVSWGWENKEVPVRLCGQPGSGLRNYRFEVKCVDGTSNPYLVAAGLLAAGMDGVRRAMPLTAEGVSGGLAASLSEAERKRKGVNTRMPLKLEQARMALKEDALLSEVLGTAFVDAYLAVNKTLADVLTQGTPDEQMQRMIRRY